MRDAKIALDTPLTDRHGRLLSFSGKVELPCPLQDDKTLVLLIFGQSNAANHAGQRFESNDPRIVNYSGGKCFQASSPLLGPEGSFGESWTLLATKLMATRRYSHIVIASGAIGGTSVEAWTPEGDLAPIVQTVIADLHRHYRPTQVLWHQGEADFLLQTSKKTYLTGLRAVIESIRQAGVDAPVFICIASFEQIYKHWQPDNPITEAQHEIVDGKTIFPGPDTDINIKAVDRYDGTHFSATGQEKFANEWVKVLSAPPSSAARLK